jgi:hypothetical protein
VAKFTSVERIDERICPIQRQKPHRRTAELNAVETTAMRRTRILIMGAAEEISTTSTWHSAAIRKATLSRSRRHKFEYLQSSLSA